MAGTGLAKRGEMLGGDSHHAGGKKGDHLVHGEVAEGYGEQGQRKDGGLSQSWLIRGAASQDAEEGCAAVLAARLA